MTSSIPPLPVVHRDIVDLYASRYEVLKPTGFAAWDLALGGITPGVARILGPRALELSLATAAAAPGSADNTLVVGAGRSGRVLAQCARTAGLVEPRFLDTSEMAQVIEVVRRHEPTYVVLDRLESIRMVPTAIRELDAACLNVGATLFACGTYDSSHAARIGKSIWSYAVQTVRLISETPGHANGIFELRVTDNPFASPLASVSVVRIRVSPAGRIELAASTDEIDPDGPFVLEVREVSPGE
ncbi:hypothetical protein [Mycobacteroides abscessus]|uniref:hypothetical protein n=1 Tax=Mycobacteroides abscessus TaxID=36809 RepID=UPI0013000B63|nr:hypothetical protein [Mycobacteroides abscessus]